ncbi:hypothetical protein AEGHOMDF_4488 [Methylobacterium soli]|nr:hypothetical protein AEGHOMDF_4488 [Methylobacterium soli]
MFQHRNIQFRTSRINVHIRRRGHNRNLQPRHFSIGVVDVGHLRIYGLERLIFRDFSDAVERCGVINKPSWNSAGGYRTK